MNARQKVRTIVAREGFPEDAAGEAPSGGEGLKRNIPAKHDFDPRALKPLARALFSSSVALGHSVTAYKEFARLKSSAISPDGMIGGRGYVLRVRDLRAQLQQACEILSSVTDTMYDEINAPHWKPRLGELGANEAEDITEFIEESGEVLDDPEAFGEEAVERVEKKNDGPSGTSNEKKWKATPEGQASLKDDSSKLPSGGDQEVVSRPKSPKQANSSVAPSTLPGPRVDHLDPSKREGPGGSYNKDEPLVEDDWGLNDGIRPKRAEVEAWGQSVVPDASFDPTDTDADDFGLGFGAKGRGSKGYGTTAPNGRGVWGPASELPKAASEDRWKVGCSGGVCTCGGTCGCKSKLPNDGQDPVSRSDYFQGDKGNQFNVSLADSSLPGDGVPALYTVPDETYPGVGYNVERNDTPYVRYDLTTKNYRNQTTNRTDNDG